jgi:hypothetical protein
MNRVSNRGINEARTQNTAKVSKMSRLDDDSGGQNDHVAV